MSKIASRHYIRRVEILQLLRQRLTVREISQHTGKPEKIIRWHIERIMKRRNRKMADSNSNMSKQRILQQAWETALIRKMQCEPLRLSKHDVTNGKPAARLMRAFQPNAIHWLENGFTVRGEMSCLDRPLTLIQ